MAVDSVVPERRDLLGDRSGAADDQWTSVEKEIDRRPVPPQPGLAVPSEERPPVVAGHDLARQCNEELLGAIGVEEDVDMAFRYRIRYHADPYR